jgi:carboxyl-terminal processing protease
MKRLILIVTIFSFLFVSCKKKVDPLDTYTLNERGRDALYDLMGEWYLWYKDMPKVNLTTYKDPFELMLALRYKAFDRWSFVADYDAFVANAEGSFVGHGIRMGLDASNKVRIVMIYKNSPLYPKGVRRGWIIKKINGTDLAPVFISGDAAAYNQLFGPSTAGYPNTFLFQTPEGKDSTITTNKAAFQVNSVTYYDTLNLSSGKTGYLVFDEFIEPSSQELQTAFDFFRQKNVKDLILDLRYNSGGIFDVAIELSSFIAGLPATTTLVKSIHNDQKTSENSTTYFKTMTSSLNLSRLVVICTRETASASEVVINGLKPFLNVVCIGDTTNGKPTGMEVWSYEKKFIYAPVTFKLVNSADDGDFYSGFAPAKYVPDDITHDFKDRNELCLKEAIHYMETGTVSTKGSYIYTPSRQFSERPRLMNNTIITSKESLQR